MTRSSQAKGQRKAKADPRIKSESPGPPALHLLGLSRIEPPSDDEDDELLLVPRSTPQRNTKSRSPMPAHGTTATGSPMRVSTPSPPRTPEDQYLPPRPPTTTSQYTEFMMSLRGSTSTAPSSQGRSSPTSGLVLRHSQDEDDSEEEELDEEEEEEVRQMSVSLSPPPSPGLCLEDLRPLTPTRGGPFDFMSPRDRPVYTPPSSGTRPSSRASGLYSSIASHDTGEVSMYTATEMELEKPLRVAYPWDTPTRVLDPRNRVKFHSPQADDEVYADLSGDMSIVEEASRTAPRKSVDAAYVSLKEFTGRTSSPGPSTSISLATPCNKVADDNEDSSGEESDQESLDLGTVKILGDRESAEKVMGILRLVSFPCAFGFWILTSLPSMTTISKRPRPSCLLRRRRKALDGIAMAMSKL